MNMHKRLERLEARAGRTGSAPEDWGRRSVTLYLKEVENHQRGQEGLPPIPLTEEEFRWQRQLDEEFLRDGLPSMRASPGWQSAEAQECLDEWEHEITAKHTRERSQ
jgi:hypothetical protein